MQILYYVYHYENEMLFSLPSQCAKLIIRGSIIMILRHDPYTKKLFWYEQVNQTRKLVSWAVKNIQCCQYYGKIIQLGWFFFFFFWHQFQVNF